MARMKLTPKKDERGGERWVLCSKEDERWVEEARRLEDVGSSPLSLPTRQLAQMAVEARPSMSGKEEPARREL